MEGVTTGPVVGAVTTDLAVEGDIMDRAEGEVVTTDLAVEGAITVRVVVVAVTTDLAVEGVTTGLVVEEVTPIVLAVVVGGIIPTIEEVEVLAAAEGVSKSDLGITIEDLPITIGDHHRGYLQEEEDCMMTNVTALQGPGEEVNTTLTITILRRVMLYGIYCVYIK